MAVDKEAIERMHKDGWSAPRIAAELGCSAETVRRWRKREGLQPPRPANAWAPITPERKEAARRLLDDGAPYEEVSRTLGMTTVTLKRHFPGRQWTRQQAGELASWIRYTKELERRQAA
jgi:transposase-like protein